MNAFATGITSGIDKNSAEHLFVFLVVVAPTTILGIVFLPTYIFFRKKKKHQLRKVIIVFLCLFFLVLLNALGAYYWY